MLCLSFTNIFVSSFILEPQQNMKYPIGIQSFDQIREDGYVYVDKTGLIYNLVTQGKTYFLSRPRRFGKSLLVSTLACYFQGRKDLFAGLEIDGLEKDWYEYPIFRIDFNGGLYTQPGILEATIEGYLGNWEDIYGKNPNYTTIGTRFIEILRRAYEQTGRRAVVLIDEYDKPILDVLDTEACFYDFVAVIINILIIIVVRAVTIKARIAVITQIHATLYMISFFIIALYIFPLGKACNIE